MDVRFNFGLKNYSREWKLYRRIFTQHINPSPAALSPSFTKTQVISTNRCLRLMLQKPQDLRENIMFCIASIILGITYGYQVQASNDSRVALADKAVQMFGEGLQLKFLPNIFPLARHIPGWFPGNRFAAHAKETAKVHHELQEVAFNDCIKRIRAGDCPPCFVQIALEAADEPGADPMAKQAIKEIAAVMYEAGVDTTGSATQSLIIQLILHPELQQRAHEELDRVIGSPNSPAFRFPQFEDRAAFPYITALCHEILRFRPPAPLGLQHATTEDDVYRGWKIPKGAVIVGNSWGMSQDEAVYSNPEVFNPDRFIGTPSKPAEPYPNTTFGFGRRICPGRGLADQSLWILIACLLAAFQFTPAKDENGNDINIDYAAGVRPGFISDPGPFPCTVLPRSKIVENAINELDV